MAAAITGHRTRQIGNLAQPVTQQDREVVEPCTCTASCGAPRQNQPPRGFRVGKPKGRQPRSGRDLRGHGNPRQECQPVPGGHQPAQRRQGRGAEIHPPRAPVEGTGSQGLVGEAMAIVQQEQLIGIDIGRPQGLEPPRQTGQSCRRARKKKRVFGQIGPYEAIVTIRRRDHGRIEPPGKQVVHQIAGHRLAHAQRRALPPCRKTPQRDRQKVWRHGRDQPQIDAPARSVTPHRRLETAHLANHATDRSLVILDEVGRGTSTFDGVAIAWAVTEYLAQVVGCRTLFATHYHELTALAGEVSGVFNLHVSVEEWGDDVVFLHRIQDGGTDRSYGIHVARLAGLPRPVLERARGLLGDLNTRTDGLGTNGTGAGAGAAPAPPSRGGGGQLSLFGPEPDPLRVELADLDPDTMAPIDALLALRELVRRARSS